MTTRTQQFIMMHTNSIEIIVHTNITNTIHSHEFLIVHTLIVVNTSSTVLEEWEDPHLGHHLVFGIGHDIQTSQSKQLSL
jgi:hypothetical protein